MVNMGHSGHLSIYFHSFEALNDAFEVQIFQGLIFTPYTKDTDII